MKTWYTIALALCIYTPTMHANYDDYTKGTMLGAMLMGSCVLFTTGMASLYNTHDLNHQAANSVEQKNVTSLRKAADLSFSKGINAIAIGTALGIAAGIGLSSNVLTPNSEPSKS
jgi:hypothetical protein